MVRARESPQCAICEFVMTQLENMLQDQTTEVRHAYWMSNMVIKCKPNQPSPDGPLFVSGGSGSCCGEGLHCVAQDSVVSVSGTN